METTPFFYNMPCASREMTIFAKKKNPLFSQREAESIS